MRLDAPGHHESEAMCLRDVHGLADLCFSVGVNNRRYSALEHGLERFQAGIVFAIGPRIPVASRVFECRADHRRGFLK